MVEGCIQRIAGSYLVVQTTVVVSRKHLRCCNSVCPTELSAIADGRLSNLTLLCCNKYNTVSGTCSIDGSRCILQYGNAFNLGWVEVVESLGAEVL